MIKRIVIQTSNQIDSQHKSAAAIPIFFRQNPKDFQMSDDVFNHYSLRCQLPIIFFLGFGQLSAFWFLNRGSGVLMNSRQPLITTIRQTFNLFRQLSLAVFVKRKIVSRSLRKSRVNNPFGFQTSPNLSFYRMPFFLARIISLLFFLGRSIGLSTTSTTTTSMSVSKSGRRLSGTENSFDCDKIFSTLVIMRETLDSLIPQLIPMWNWVRYSRQYSKATKTWSSMTSLGFLPSLKNWEVDFSLTNWHIFSKVSFSTPQYRLKSGADSFFSFS